MQETCGDYSASVVDTGEGINCDIDVRPPFVSSKGLFDLCADECGVRLAHFVSTPNTTRVSAYIVDESLVDEPRGDEVIAARFRDAAAFLVKVLHLVDEGEDVMFHKDYVHYEQVADAQPEDGVAPESGSDPKATD